MVPSEAVPPPHPLIQIRCEAPQIVLGFCENAKESVYRNPVRITGSLVEGLFVQDT